MKKFFTQNMNDTPKLTSTSEIENQEAEQSNNTDIWDALSVKIDRSQGNVVGQYLRRSNRISSLLDAALKKAHKPTDEISFSIHEIASSYPNQAIITLNILDTAKNEVGFIKFSLSSENKSDDLPNEPQIHNIIKTRNPYQAKLATITVFEGNQGKGYSSSGLKIFHAFLDAVNVDFATLDLISNTPYAGKSYKNADYVFTHETMEYIKRWGLQQQFLPETDIEQEFLKDTSRNIGCVVSMIRYNQRDDAYNNQVISLF